MFALAIHGGAGTIARATLLPADEKLYRTALELALNTGYDLLRDGAPALDCVCPRLVACIRATPF